MKTYLVAVLIFTALLGSNTYAQGQSKANGNESNAVSTIKGRVKLEGKDQGLHGVIVVITQLKRSTVTDDDGNYEFKNVPPGSYNLAAKMDRLSDSIVKIEASAGATINADIEIKLTGIKDSITVSATGNDQSIEEAFQGVTSVDSTSILEKDTTSLGESLERYPGIAKRSFGPGSARPVIRGFDGDRVLIAQDGVRSGTLSYSSGDHGEPVNLLAVEKVEVVRGPATLLYGSSAIGGLVNIISGHEEAHQGLRGYVTGEGSTNRNLGGGSAGLEYGVKNFMVWANGGGQESNDYYTPAGRVHNSAIQYKDVSGGMGIFKDKGFFTTSYSYNRNIYGVPYDPNEEGAEIPTLNPTRNNLRLNGGLNNISSLFEHLHLTFDYTHYKHEELIEDVVETTFKNQTYNWRGVLDQRRNGRFSGSIGASGYYRDYQITGEEMLAPPTKQNSFAFFALEGIDFKRFALQFGARLEHNGYNPEPISENIRDRSFTGFSGSAGIRVPLFENATFATNYTHSYRAPSLDELYNFGPHPGNITFEIGNPNLKRELGDGVDVSFRYSPKRVRGEFHYFFYSLRDFIYLAPTGDVEDGLTVADYLQGNSRYQGTELSVDINLFNNLWLNTGMDYVRAELTANGQPLPRIPPLRSRIGFDYQYKGLSIRPEFVAVSDQDRIYTTETRTPGYGVVNLSGSYTVAQNHTVHIFGVNAFNLNNKLYFNHLSFIKEIAPEIGRGVRFTYTVRFF